MRVSERLTARHEHRRAADRLAASVASFLAANSRQNAVAMHDALQAYTEARTVLDG